MDDEGIINSKLRNIHTKVVENKLTTRYLGLEENSINNFHEAY
jgi:hypothetical protein